MPKSCDACGDTKSFPTNRGIRLCRSCCGYYARRSTRWFIIDGIAELARINADAAMLTGRSPPPRMDGDDPRLPDLPEP